MAESWERILEILSESIKFKTRADSLNAREDFDNMFAYLERLGIAEQVQSLKVIHVAGTKGKGSTCAMVESMLRACGYRTGLYTSPHLMDVRERVRINGSMVSKELFTECFWWCHNRLREKATAELGTPGYFRMLTLLGLKIFLEARVDVVILEVGLGGRLDATNIIRSPVVCGITSLGYDHMEILGNTLTEISREKAGILKAGRPAFTVPQPAEAMQALKERAESVGAPLLIPPMLDAYRLPQGGTLELGISGEHQKVNAALAVQLAGSWESQAAAASSPSAAARVQQLAEGQLPAEYAQGLAAASWMGRSQVIEDEEVREGAQEQAGTTSQQSSAPSRLTFYVDGAHTPESMVTCANWLADAVPPHPPTGAPSGLDQRVLLFNCMRERDPEVLLPELVRSLRQRGLEMHHAVFVPPQSGYGFLTAAKPPSNGSAPTSPVPVDLSWQRHMQQAWQKAVTAEGGPRGSQPLLPLPAVPGLKVQDTSRGAVMASLPQTLDWLRRCVRQRGDLKLQVLVAGSLYLVGDVLRMLGKQPT